MLLEVTNTIVCLRHLIDCSVVGLALPVGRPSACREPTRCLSMNSRFEGAPVELLELLVTSLSLELLLFLPEPHL